MRLAVKVRGRSQEDPGDVKVRLTAKGRRLVERTPNPIQGKMIGLRSSKKEQLDSTYASVKKLMGIMEFENVKVIFFLDHE